MRYVFASYVYVKGFDDPVKWLYRIEAFTGILSALAKENEVHAIQQINFKGLHKQESVTYHFNHYPRTELRFFPLQLNRDIKSLKPDVVVIQGLHCPLRVLQLRAIIGSKVKIILQHRAEKPFIGYRKIFQQMADIHVDAYLFGSKLLAQQWIRLGNLKSMGKIYEVAGLSSTFYPISKSVAMEKTGATGSPIFLWVGRLNTNKDPITVITAFLKFAEISPNAQLYLSYQTKELLPQLMRIATKHPNGKQINLLGHIPHPKLLYWFNAADYLISGSHYEGGGTVLCEAMSVGCIPVVTDIAPFKVITKNGNCGLCYEPGNVDALLKALKDTQIINQNAQKNRCLAFFKSDLSFEAIAHKIQEISSTL